MTRDVNGWCCDGKGEHAPDCRYSNTNCDDDAVKNRGRAPAEAPAPSQTEATEHDLGCNIFGCKGCSCWCHKPQAAQTVASSYQEEKHCCTVCDAKKACHVCGDQTLLACSDCAINFGATVYVCKKSTCRDEHELKCFGCKPVQTVASPSLRDKADDYAKRLVESRAIPVASEGPISNALELFATDYAATLEARVAAQKNIIATLGEGKSAAEERAEKAEALVVDQQATFDLMWAADQRAIKQWQEATGQDHIWPDRAKLTTWLLERADTLAVSLRDVGETLIRLMPVLICRHEHTRGGNDYISCEDCGFEWNYAKSNPLYAVTDQNNDISALLTRLQVKL